VSDPWVLSIHPDGNAPVRPQWVTHRFMTARTNLGMTWRFHDLRHFSVTEAIAAGVDIRSIAGRHGHADASITLRVYAHASEVADQLAAQALGRALSGHTGGLLSVKDDDRGGT
jgi:integrase